MSQIEVPEEIEHLDFEPEKRERKIHWGDPISCDHYWCGEKMSPRPFSECGILHESKVTCVKCLQLALALGLDWWWETHCRFFGSHCTSGKHDCGA